MAEQRTRSKAETPPEAGVDWLNTPIEEPEGGVFRAYANVVNIDWSLYDLRIRFAELMRVLNDDSPSWTNQHGVLLELAAIRLPWHQVKALRDMLSAVISNYEKVNGELKPVKLPAATGT